MSFRRTTGAVLTIVLALLSLRAAVAEAAMVATPGRIEAYRSGAPGAEAVLAARLVALGVPPAEARARAAGLTPEEREALEARLARAPAGGDVIGALAFAALVLLLTDILGYTDVYPFVSRTVNGERSVAAGPGECVPAATAAATR